MFIFRKRDEMNNAMTLNYETKLAELKRNRADPLKIAEFEERKPVLLTIKQHA